MLVGYEQAESEKRLFKTSMIAAGTLLLVGSATGFAALLETGSLHLLLFLPIAQIPILALVGHLHIWSLRLTAYALNLELQIERLIGSRSLSWELEWFMETKDYRKAIERSGNDRPTGTSTHEYFYPNEDPTHRVSLALLCFAVFAVIVEIVIGLYFSIERNISYSPSLRAIYNSFSGATLDQKIVTGGIIIVMSIGLIWVFWNWSSKQHVLAQQMNGYIAALEAVKDRSDAI